ncbi:uncharacterized protein At3g28850-like [Pyrus communis]|uniref:uncharacterized protein At3g28850-like n=1 Tax=Pyrus communis TaxID=23211 RepID=UPI0035C075EE
MKGVKGKLMMKLKSIGPIGIGYLKPQDRVLQVNASDAYADSNLNIQTHNLISEETEQKKKKIKQLEKNVTEQEPDVIDVTELMRDLEDEEESGQDGDDIDVDDKENVRPKMVAKHPVECSKSWVKTESNLEENRASEASENRRQTPLSEIDISSFRRPDLNSGSLFDPDLLAAFQQAVMEYMRLSEEEKNARRSEKEDIESNFVEAPDPEPELEPAPPSNEDALLALEEKCPPGSLDSSVVLYTTTLRGIRKTFDDCNSVRFLLESFRVVFYERDVSMHMEFRQELWKILDCKAVPPKLFIKGRYIGGAEEVLTLHEQGKLKPLFEGVPLDRSIGPCEACDGVRFVVCFRCSGSCKLIADEGQPDKCPECNENGLIICPLCC